MMKYLILVALMLCLPVRGEAWQVVGGGSAPDGDTCTGTQLFAAHFENNDDVTQGTPAGCSVGDTTVTRTGVTYSATQASDGSYSSYSTVENSKSVIDSTNMDVSITGTWCGDIYYTQTVTRTIFAISLSPSLSGKIVYAAGANKLSTTYGSETYTGSDTFTNETWTRVCFSWDASPSVGADKLAVKVGTNAWQAQTNRVLTSLSSNPTTYYITGGFYAYYPGYVDNVKLYSDYAHVE